MSDEKFALPESTPRSSETTVNVGGLLLHIYGAAELTPAQKGDTVVLLHAHGRTRSHLDAANIAHQLLHDIRAKGCRRGLVVAAFDNRNHGIRKIDDISIQSWAGGNVHHAQDMAAMVDGISLDLHGVVKYLSAYISSTLFTPTEFIASGVSLGGHATWNLLAMEPSIKVAIPIVGTTDLHALLLDRVQSFLRTKDVPADAPEWPLEIQNLLKARDAVIAGIKGKKILILNGEVDAIVPDVFTKDWVEKYAANNEVTYIHQAETGHFLSFAGLNRMVEFILPTLE
ncbi:Alpha/Beta hydrolase protein [Limtongia smithiae]|uniref:Alpha/Beta hydrolase protein n=1 Tax=Limtongia smithiae TaxID=1125753 RepID=UPI0034CDC5F4